MDLAATMNCYYMKEHIHAYPFPQTTTTYEYLFLLSSVSDLT